MDDIDLFIGMIQEIPVGEHEGDAKVGKTLQCLIGDVFSRLRIGDRYFYDNADLAGSFTPGIDDFRFLVLHRNSILGHNHSHTRHLSILL